MSRSVSDVPASAPRPGVSAVRRRVSSTVLVIAIAVLAIEVHASLGHRNSAKALSELAPEGVFDNHKFSDVQSRISLFPTVSVIRDNEDERVYCYRWFSLLRPALGQASAELFLVCSPDQPPLALAYFTDPNDAASGFYGDKVPAEDAVEAMNGMEMDAFGIPLSPSLEKSPDASANSGSGSEAEGTSSAGTDSSAGDGFPRRDLE